jgi:hypothetical protein
MTSKQLVRTGARAAASALAVGAAAYGAYAAVTWLRYGRTAPPDAREADVLLDAFMPRYDVVHRNKLYVHAPADVTLAAAEEQDLMQAPVVNAIFRMRQAVMGAPFEPEALPRPLIEQVRALGWVELARIPGREVVMGAVTQPWKGEAVFRGVPAREFAAFAEPGFVKIVWTLRADPDGPEACWFRSETRVVATDADARARFRNYWAFVSPGVSLIRRLSSGPMKREAERRAAAVWPGIRAWGNSPSRGKSPTPGVPTARNSRNQA